MLDFLRQEGIDDALIARIEQFRRDWPVSEEDLHRIPSPKFQYYGKEIWALALTALTGRIPLLAAGRSGRRKRRRGSPDRG